MPFDPEAFEKFLRSAAAALDAATDLLVAAETDDVADPGAMYLLGRLEIAQSIIELELPEFACATLKTIQDMVGGAE